MQFQISCPGCRTVLAIEAMPGQQVQCPACGTLMLLTPPPAAAPPPEPAAPPPPPPPSELDFLAGAVSNAPSLPRPGRGSIAAPPARGGRVSLSPPAPPTAGAAPAAPGAPAPAGKTPAPGQPGSPDQPADGQPEGPKSEGEIILDWLKRNRIAVGSAAAALVLAVTLWIVLGRGSGTPNPDDAKKDDKSAVKTPPAGTPTSPTNPDDESPDAAMNVWLPPEAAVLGHHRMAHGEAVNSAAFTPDGRKLISGGWDAIVRVWDAGTGRLERRLVGHTDTVWAVTVSPDGLLAATGGADKEFRIWEISTAKLLHSLPVPGGLPVRAMAFAKDSRTLAVGGDAGQLVIYDAPAGSETRTVGGHDGPINAVAFSPDGVKVATACRDTKVRIIPVDRKAGSNAEVIPFHRAGVTGVAFSPDGKKVAAIDEAQVVTITDLTNNTKAAQFGGGGRVGLSGIAWSGDGTRVLTGHSDGKIKVWTPKDRAEPEMTLSGHTRGVSAIVTGKDGRLATASGDRTVRLWNLDTGRERKGGRWGHAGTVFAIAHRPDGAVFVSGGDDGVVRLWSTSDPSAKPAVLQGGHEAGIKAAAWTRDGTGLATAGFDGRVVIWNLQGAKPGRVVTAHPKAANCIAWAPDAKRFVTGSEDGTLRLFQVTDGSIVGTPAPDHEAPVTGCAWTPDGGAIVSVGADGSARVRKNDLTGKPVVAFTSTKALRALAMSSDGKWFAAGGDDRLVRVFDAAGQVSAVFQATRGPVRGLSFRQDGKALAVASGWGEVAVVDPEDARLLQWVRFPSPFEAAAFTREGRRLVTANSNSSLYVIDVSPTRDIIQAVALSETEEQTEWSKVLAEETDPGQARSAAAGAARLGTALPVGDVALLCVRLGDADAGVRTEASKALSAAGPAAVPLLVATFRAPGAKPEKRVAALRALAGMQAEGAPLDAVVGPALSDPDTTVRTAAAEVFASRGGTAVTQLLALLKSPDPGVRKTAEAGLAKVELNAELVKIVKTATDAATRITAVQAVGFAGRDADTEARTIMLGLLRDRDPRMRAAAAGTLGRIDRGTADAVAMLAFLTGMADEEKPVRIAALRGLAALGRSAGDAAPAVLSLFGPDQKDPDLKAEAASALVEFGPMPAEAAASLFAAMADPRPEVRRKLAAAIAMLGEGGRDWAYAAELLIPKERDEAVRKTLEAYLAKLAIPPPTTDN